MIARAPGASVPLSSHVLEERLQYTQMDGPRVYRFATQTVRTSLEHVASQSGIGLDEVDLFILHQANARILTHIAYQLDLPIEKVAQNLDRYANTSSASIPIALSEALTNGRAQTGSLLALSGFGTGLSWATTLFSIGPTSIL